jgi:hypothetical protein
MEHMLTYGPVPWALDHSVRPRHCLDFSALDDKAARAVRTELRVLELLFLFLSLASPALGALLLERASALLLDASTLLWLLSGAFVLAATVRSARRWSDTNGAYA